MKRNKFISICLSLTATMLTACELRPLYHEGLTARDVIVSINWGQLGSIPEEATILFYPLPLTDGQVYEFHTNSVEKATVQVPSGDYTVLAYNRTADGYGSLYFRDIEQLGLAKCLLFDKHYTWPSWSSAIRTTYEPEDIAVGKIGFLHVRTLSETAHNTETDSVMVTPQRMVMAGTIKIRIEGIQNFKSAKGYLTGMAGGAYLSTRSATDTLATHVIENWNIDRDASDYTKGYLNASFRTFGLPEQYLINQNIRDNQLNITILLADNSTTEDFSFYVGDRIEEKRTTLSVNLAIGMNNGVGDTAIILPDVIPATGDSSGFNIGINEWDNPEDVIIPL